MLGNLNNLVMSRARDPATIKHLEFMPPHVPLHTVSSSRNECSHKNGAAEGISARIEKKDIPMVPSYLFTELSDLCYFAKMKSGEALLRQMPVITASGVRGRK